MWLRRNPRLTRPLAALGVALLTAASHSVLTQDQPSLRGVVVEEVGKGSAGEKAGIQPGDVVLSWVRVAAPPANPEEARGEIRSPFDFADVELEQAPRGEVQLFLSRSGKNLSVTVPPGTWAISVRPPFGEPLLSRYQHGRELLDKQIDRAAELWRDLAAEASAAPEQAAWLLVKTGDALTAARRWDVARDAYRSAYDVVQASGNATVAARIRDAEGLSFERQNDLPGAEAAYRDVVRIHQRAPLETLALAASLSRLGTVARSRGDLASAAESFRAALAVAEKLAPASLTSAITLNNLGGVAYERGDLAGAEQFLRRSLAVRERLVPDSIEVARSLNNLGVVARNRGDPAAAEDFHRRSLAIKETLAPDSLDVAASFNNLGTVASDRGDLVAAEEFHKRSLAIHERQAPDSLTVAMAVNNLGVLALYRGEAPAAEALLRRSLTIREKLAPDSLDVALSLYNLGDVALERGDLAAAEGLYLRSVAIREKLAPDSLVVAESLNALGLVARTRGDSVAAERAYTRALALHRALAPGSTGEAKSLHALGLLARGSNRAAAAVDYYQQAIVAVEAQTGRLGGAEEVRAGFTAQYSDYYREYIDLLIELGQPAGALQALERSRARSLLAMLAERDLVFATDLPADLARERSSINADYDRTQAAIAALNPGKDAAGIDRLLARLRELRDRREQVAQTIRKTSPRFASLVYPQPLDLAGAQSSLDQGTVLLAYAVAKEKTFLFVVQASRPPVRTAPPLSVFTLPIGEAALREKVAAIRNLIQRGAQVDAPADALTTAGQELFATLIEPARGIIAASDRVLISPDGPLHTLPFAALAQPSARGPARYFVEWKPLHIVASATVYAELKRTRRVGAAAPAALTLAAFGDPAYPPPAVELADRLTNPEVRAAVRRGYALEPLPASRREVEGIVRLYPGRAATYLGDQATEERAKAVGRDVRYLHFASHGLLDERFPLNSALALTIPERPGDGQANGLLQAWEIFEQVRIDADLVTLSACETGLGKELGGEGLLGLTRAFQYAGARTVLASLWSVGDDSTADLMTRLYGHLKAGRTKDEALRAAQLEMIRGRGTSHPFQWAAFQLAGDWR